MSDVSFSFYAARAMKSCSAGFRWLRNGTPASPEEDSTRPQGSDDSHVSLHLLDHRIQSAAQHLPGETEGEPLDGVERGMGRHGKRQGIYHCVDNDRAILVRESFSQTFSHVPRFLDTNSFRAHCLSNLGEIRILELHPKRNKAGLLLFDVDEIELLVVENDLNDGSSSFHLRQQIADSPHGKASVSAQCDALPAGICQSTSERVWCSVGHGGPRERAKEPAVFSTVDMSRKPDTGRTSVRKEHGVIRSEFAECRSDEFRTYRFYPRSLLNVVLQQFVEGVGVRNLLRQKLSICLFLHGWNQCTDRRLDIADKAEIQRCTAADVLRVLVNLNLFHLGAGKKFGERKISAQQEQKVGFINCVVRSPVTDQPGHANGVRIIMLQPLLPAEGIADRGLKLGRQFNHFVAAFSATVAAKDRYRFRFIDHPHQFFEVGIGRSQDSRACDGEVGRLVSSIGGRDIARNGKNGGPLLENSRDDGGADDRAGLFRINQPRGVKRSRLEKLVRIQLLERRCVNNARLYIPGDRDNWSSFFPCVHQSVE